MTFKSSTDQNPVLLDKLGNPLKNGQVSYYEVGTINVPKIVYSDIARTMPLQNPIALNDYGRTDTQVFLGYGEYTVISKYRYGVDSFAEANQWNETGLTLSETEEALTVGVAGTIDALRHFSTTSGTVSVLGYFAEGDLWPRTYFWGPWAADNGGTIIEQDGVLDGAWHLLQQGAEVDSRIFGIFPDGFTDQRIPLFRATQAELSPSVLAFSPGEYYLTGSDTFTFPLTHFYSGAKFIKAQAGTSYFDIPYGSQIDITGSFSSDASFGLISPRFLAYNSNQDVKVEWWHDSNEPEYGYALSRMAACIKPANTVYTDSILEIGSLSSNLVMANDFVFAPGAGFNMTVGGNTLTLTGPGTVRGVGCFGAGVTNRLKFQYYKSISASWFEDRLAPGQTRDLSAVLPTLTTSPSTVFECDIPCVFSTTASPLTQYVFQGASTVTCGLNPVLLPRCDFDPIANLSPRIVQGTKTSLVNYPDFESALYSAANGSGELDMEGLSSTVSASTVTPILATTSLWIHDGVLNPTGSANALTLEGTFKNLTLSDIDSAPGSNASLVRLAGAYANHVRFERTSFANIFSGSPTAQLIRFAGSNVSALGIDNCSIDVPYLTSVTSGLVNTQIHDNQNLVGELNLSHASIIATGNQVKGLKWDISGKEGLLLSGNSFYAMGITLSDHEGSLSPVLYGNSISVGKYVAQPLTLKATTLKTVLSGANIYGNSWIEGPDAKTVVITSEGTFAVAADALVHRINISGNVTANYKLVAPVTRGWVPMGQVYVGTGNVTTDEQERTDVLFFGNNPGIFLLPDPMPGTVCWLSEARQRNIANDLVVRSIAWDKTFYTQVSPADKYMLVNFLDHNIDVFKVDRASEIKINLYS